MKQFMICLCLCAVFFACNDGLKSEGPAGPQTDSGSASFDTSSLRPGAALQDAEVSLVMEHSKQAIDSIDAADKEIREQSMGTLTATERQQVNKALAVLGNARDLITLQIQNAVIKNLKIKTAALQVISRDINARSEKLSQMAETLSRVTAVIESTTNMLASALSAGIVRPPLKG